MFDSFTHSAKHSFPINATAGKTDKTAHKVFLPFRRVPAGAYCYFVLSKNSGISVSLFTLTIGVALDGTERLVADDMLDTACIHHHSFLIHS